MLAATITKWALSPTPDALEHDLECPLSKSEIDGMKWQEVTAEPRVLLSSVDTERRWMSLLCQ